MSSVRPEAIDPLAHLRDFYTSVMEIQLFKGDITTVATDAVVNAANSSLLGGGGVDGAIHRKGGKDLLDACIAIRNRQGGCATGKAVITTAGNLPAKYVIHTVGPVWRGGDDREPALLQDCYRNSLELALEYGLKTVAFPNISTGIYHFPKEPAARIALDIVRGFHASDAFEEITFVCFDDENHAIYQELMS
jgi:O-acetyl-ADP-ribose deacetylase (regulator of RNase III)